MEVPLITAASSSPRQPGSRRLGRSLLAGALATVLLLGGRRRPAVADNNPNNYDCRGHVEKGAAVADDPGPPR